MGKFPLDCFVVGYRLEDNSLILYAEENDLKFYMDASEAMRTEDWLNRDPRTRLPDAKTKWEVYEMSFKKHSEVRL